MRRRALWVIFISMVVIGAGYASAFREIGPPRVAAFAFALAVAAVMTAILVLGATRKNARLGALKWVFTFTFAVLAGGFCVALTDGAAEPGRLFIGLPRGAAIMLYIVGLMPMAVLPIAYALTFDETTLNEAQLNELRRKLQELRTPEARPEAEDVLG